MNESITLRQLQDIYLVMLQQFHDFCVEQNLTYYMVGGTLLGAVREKGFIPWDDDVDIAMPRRDYETFLKIYTGNGMLCAPGRNKKCCFPYTKLFNSTFPIVHIEDKQLGMDGDVMVQFDIYPIDGLGNDYRKARKCVEKVRKYNYFLYLNQSEDYGKNPIKNMALYGIRRLSGAAIAKAIDRKMRAYRKIESEFITRWRAGLPDGNIVTADVFGKPALLPFESLLLFAPQKYEAYLTSIYGNYKEPCRQNVGLRHNIKNYRRI